MGKIFRGIFYQQVNILKVKITISRATCGRPLEKMTEDLNIILFYFEK